MKSQAVVEFGQPLQQLQSEMAEPQGSEVVVKVKHCGVCHTDLHLHDGYYDLGGGDRLEMGGRMHLPHTMGHEIQGEVVALGPDADGVELGENVVVYPWIGCGSCGVCSTGREQLCSRGKSLGVFAPGGYAEAVMVPHSRYLIPIGDVDPRQAAISMCAGLTALSSLKKLESAVASGPWMILGLGGVGMMALQIARVMYDREPLVADIDPEKLKLAESYGVAGSFNLSDPQVKKAVKKATDGGLTGLVDFVGAEATINFDIGVMAQGGHIVLVGMFGGSLVTPLPLIPMRAMTIQGSYVGSLDEARQIIALLKEGTISPLPIVERPLCEANDALNDLRNGKVMGRTVLSS